MKGNDKKMIWRRWRRDLEEEHLDMQSAFKEHTRERRRRCASGKHGRPLGAGTGVEVPEVEAGERHAEATRVAECEQRCVSQG